MTNEPFPVNKFILGIGIGLVTSIVALRLLGVLGY